MGRKTTRYFQEQILIRREYLRMEWVEFVILNHQKKEVQHDGRIKMWAFIEIEQKWLRVVLLEDGETVHNAFFDRDGEKK